MNFFLLVTFASLMRCEFISATAAATVSKKAGGGKTSASLKRSQLSICKICWCSKELDLIDCNTEHVLVKQLERHLGSSRNLTINSTHFDNLRERVESIYIDFDSYNINLRIDHNALHKLGNLRQLTLVKVSELNKMLNLKHSPHLKHLRISDSGVKELSTEFCSSMHHLETVDFSRNEITDIRFVFDGCAELNVLDLSYNRIVSLDRAFNDKSSKINTLNFGNNKIERIDEHDLAALEDLVDLDLANNLIESVHENAFDRLTQLVKLDLTNNNLVSLPAHSAVYMSLKVLYVNENSRMLHFPDASQFSSIEELKVHYSYHCCQFLKKQTQRLAQTPEVKIIKFAHSVDLLSETMSVMEYTGGSSTTPRAGLYQTVEERFVEAEPFDESNGSQIVYDFMHSDCNDKQKLAEDPLFAYGCERTRKALGSSKQQGRNFTCTPIPDVLTPCENLLDDLWLRVAVWLVSLLGILSNFCVIAYNVMYSVFYYYNNHDVNVSTFLLTNLATADSLMSVYLLFIAVKDSSSRDNFDESALVWQHSFTCNLAGFLSVVSCVSSALCLVFITFERYYSIKHSISSDKRVRFKGALVVTVAIWLVSLMIATLPLLNFNSYSAYAICLPFDTKGTIYKVYIVGLNLLLVVCFFLICVLYALIFVNTLILEKRARLTSCSDEVQMRLRNAEDQKLARNITLLVMVNTICWGPVVYMCAYSLITMTPIKRSHLKILAVFVIPFNSLINPFLYCISRRNFRMYVRANFFKSRFRRNLRLSNSSTHSTTTNI